MCNEVWFSKHSVVFLLMYSAYNTDAVEFVLLAFTNLPISLYRLFPLFYYIFLYRLKSHHLWSDC